jgi:bifunctional DNA-binding transcriptional regulator/antitoxin component of YhaV-PrlF toxin-antitoxin module
MSNKSILQFPNKQQFIVTLPKGLVLAKGWKQGDKLEFTIDNKGEIIIKKSKTQLPQKVGYVNKS